MVVIVTLRRLATEGNVMFTPLFYFCRRSWAWLAILGFSFQPHFADSEDTAGFELKMPVTSARISVDENCGVAAYRAVLKGYGLSSNIEPDVETVNVSNAKSISLREMRAMFEKLDCSVRIFRFDESPSTALISYLNRLHQGSCQAILLLPTELDHVPDRERPGHFWVINGYADGRLNVFDPQSGKSATVTIDRLIHSPAASVMFVFRPFDGLLYAPIDFFDLAISALTVMFFGIGTGLAGQPAWRRMLSQKLFGVPQSSSSSLLISLAALVVAGCVGDTEWPSTHDGKYPVMGVSLLRNSYDLTDGSRRATVVLENSSKSSITVSQLVLSCSCIETNFAPAVVGSGETFECDIWLTKSLLSSGQQEGLFVTDPPTLTPIGFNVSYNLQARSNSEEVWLHPQLLTNGTIWLRDADWSSRFQVKLKGLHPRARFSQPLRLEPTPQQGTTQRLRYEIETFKQFQDVVNITINCSLQDQTVGPFRDDLRLVGETDRGEFFADLSVIGYLASDGIFE